MHHVRILFDVHQVADFHRAVIADPPKIVAAKVDQHHVFGALLLVAAKLFDQSLVFRGIGAALVSAGNRPVLQLASGDAHQHLG
jgi:hypothetical protein